MAKIVIYGASDDLLEVEGDISEEFNPQADDDEECFLAVSDGTLLKIVYDGCWRITPQVRGSANMEKVEAEGEDSANYGDRVTLEGDAVRCVALATAKAVHK